MAGYDTLYNLLREEISEICEEGRAADRQKLCEMLDACGSDKTKLMQVYAYMCSLPMRGDFGYSEPSELDEIRAQSNIANIKDDVYTDVDADYFYGAWLGRCIGCAWGQPVEGSKSQAIVDWYKNAGKYPIRSFVPTVSGDRRNEGGATDQKLCGMPLDDDTRYTVLYYLLLKNKGYDFDSWDVAEHWAWHLPFRFVCTAETQAYLNYINIDKCTPWGKPEGAMELLKSAKTNTYLNPYREWIGAQIRCDAFAYVAAGMPKLASRLAHTDAYFSHTKNGIYGEMFFAALISAAFVKKDIGECMDIALSVVPSGSRFYEMAVWARKLAESDITREKLIAELLAYSERYSWVHTLNNAAFCIAAIVRYSNDFRQAAAFAVECGADTDCNGATVGSCMGALLGAKNIPLDISECLKDTFSVGITPYDKYSIKAFADEIKALHKSLNA